MANWQLGPNHPAYGHETEGYRAPSYSTPRPNGPPRPVVDGVPVCRRCNEPVEPGKQCAACRERSRQHRRTTALEEVRAAGNLGRLAV